MKKAITVTEENKALNPKYLGSYSVSAHVVFIDSTFPPIWKMEIDEVNEDNEAVKVIKTITGFKNREALHELAGFYPVVNPPIDSNTQYIGSTLIWVEDESHYTYNVIDLTSEEIEAINKGKIPKSVKNMKLRLALIQSGISISSIDAAIQAIEDTTVRESIQTMWEYAEYYERENTQLIAMAASLGITDEQLDQLFILAETL